MLYQKYRPTTLEEIYGHKSIIEGLQKKITTGSIPHAIFISGLTGTGKTTLAYIIAKALNCDNPDDKRMPCNSCPQCEDVNNEFFTLGVKMLNASYLDTDTMRELNDFCDTNSLTSNKKIIIIDELQELHSNKKAQKVLLSLLETMRKNVHFILLAMDESKVDRAIKNRCATYNLKSVDSGDIGEYLAYICNKEGIKITKDVANALLTIGENSGGSVRDGVALLERVIDSGDFTEDAVLKIAGIISKDNLYKITSAIMSGNPDSLSTDYTDEIIGRIKWLLRLACKSSMGVELNGWEKTQVGDLPRFGKGNILFVLSKLNELIKYPYVTKDIIEVYIMEILVHTGNTKSKELPEDYSTKRLRVKKG